MSILFRILLLMMTTASPAFADSLYPSVLPGSLYVGESKGVLSQQAELYLLDANYFVLRQSFSRREMSFTRDLTGLWLQTDSGAILQLSNAHGLLLICNVGGERNLYCRFPGIGGQPADELVLQERPFSMPEFSIMGRLEQCKDHLALTDSATGRVFSPLSAETALPEHTNQPLFVDAVIRPSHEGCILTRLRSYSRNIPEPQAVQGTADFAALVAGRSWRLQSLPGVPSASCIFTPQGPGTGTMELSGQGLYLLLRYDIRGETILLQADDAAKAMLQQLKAEALLPLLHVRRWKQQGRILLLSTGQGQHFVCNLADHDPRMPR